MEGQQRNEFRVRAAHAKSFFERLYCIAFLRLLLLLTAPQGTIRELYNMNYITFQSMATPTSFKSNVGGKSGNGN